jgi:hypothetical protein
LGIAPYYNHETQEVKPKKRIVVAMKEHYETPSVIEIDLEESFSFGQGASTVQP